MVLVVSVPLSMTKRGAKKSLYCDDCGFKIGDRIYVVRGCCYCLYCGPPIVKAYLPRRRPSDCPACGCGLLDSEGYCAWCFAHAEVPCK